MIDSEIFRALADPTRRAVFERLASNGVAGGEMTVSDLKAGFAISQPAVSQHLAALKAAGLVAERREGRFAYYRAQPQGLAPLIDWVDRYADFWTQRVGRLKDVLKGMDQ